MQKLKLLLDTPDKMEQFRDNLLKRIISNKAFSDNPMIDGIIIGFFCCHFSSFKGLFLEENDFSASEATIQNIEQTLMWFANNEDSLCDIVGLPL